MNRSRISHCADFSPQTTSPPHSQWRGDNSYCDQWRSPPCLFCDAFLSWRHRTTWRDVMSPLTSHASVNTSRGYE